MRKPDFDRIGRRLLRAGIASRTAKRVVRELEEHYDDIVAAGVSDGLPQERAMRLAADALGDMDEFVVAMQSQPELRSWAFRYPRLARVAYPLACLVLLPAYPVMAGMAHAPQIARWGLCLMIAGLVTVSIFAGLRLAILFG